MRAKSILALPQRDPEIAAPRLDAPYEALTLISGYPIPTSEEYVLLALRQALSSLPAVVEGMMTLLRFGVFMPTRKLLQKV